MKWQLHDSQKKKELETSSKQPSIPTSQVNEKLIFDDVTQNENGQSPTLKASAGQYFRSASAMAELASSTSSGDWRERKEG